LSAVDSGGIPPECQPYSPCHFEGTSQTNRIEPREPQISQAIGFPPRRVNRVLN
jgi:hypothetical protein